MYRSVPRKEIIAALVHIRELYRQIKPSSEREFRVHERREAASRSILSNLPRTGEHPTLNTMREVSETFRLTLDGAHRLFGYNLDQIREYDLRVNGGRTHIIESYPFERDLLIDVPSHLAPREAFGMDARLRDLVPGWQTDIPIRVLEGEGWHQPGAFYIHIGTEDSLGSSIPPGAMALVEPISDSEKLRPNPREIYLFQFGNGYRCSHCVVTNGKLRLFTSSKTYLGSEEFSYPGSVRIAGRIRMFALSLPLPEYPYLQTLPHNRRYADLILPWEHLSRDRLFAAKHKRFQRSKEQELFVQEFLKRELNAKLSGRTERRYRRPTPSEPHIDALIHLTVAHVARYTDALRTGGFQISDRGRFSLETLLNARYVEEVPTLRERTRLPIPKDVWEARTKEFGEWPPLLSLKFPHLRRWDDRVVRLAQGSEIDDLNPLIGPGSWMLLDRAPTALDTRSERRKTGWSRPIYVLRRGLELFCGYLDRDDNRYALLSNASDGRFQITFRADELHALSRVAGIAIPV